MPVFPQTSATGSTLPSSEPQLDSQSASLPNSPVAPFSVQIPWLQLHRFSVLWTSEVDALVGAHAVTQSASEVKFPRVLRTHRPPQHEYRATHGEHIEEQASCDVKCPYSLASHWKLEVQAKHASPLQEVGGGVVGATQPLLQSAHDSNRPESSCTHWYDSESQR